MTLTDRLKTLVTRPYSTILAGPAHELVRQRRAVLLDVREAHEWNAGHAPSARHIPLGALTGRLGELPANCPVVAVCQSGMRSARAARLLARHGYEVYNLRGGMRAWVDAGLPTKVGCGQPI